MNFNYFISEPVFEFILEAVELAAAEGWRLLPEYDFDPASGLWRHHLGAPEAPLSLGDLNYAEQGMPHSAHRHRAPEGALPGYLAEARARFAVSPGKAPAVMPRELGSDFEHLRWFWLPEEIAAGVK